MTDRRETVVNVESEPARRTVYVGSGNSAAVIGGVVVAVLLIGLVFFLFARPGNSPAPTDTTVTVQTPAEPAKPKAPAAPPAASPSPQPAPATPAPATPAAPAAPAQ